MCRLKGCLKVNYIPSIAGFIHALFFLIIILLSTKGLQFSYIYSVRVISILITLTWGVLLIISKDKKVYNIVETVIAVIIFMIISAYFSYHVWSTYLTNVPILAIDAEHERVKNDLMFHVSLAQGIKYYGKPSFLINSDAFFNYHYGSHLIMAVISSVTRIPAYLVYCYLYPILFLPSYVSMIISVIIEFRIYSVRDHKISSFDLITLLFFIAPDLILPGAYDLVYDWKTSWFTSESYLIAIVILLFFIYTVLKAANSKAGNNKIVKFTLMLVVIPLFIVCCSITKVSVGFLMCIGIVYYLFRTHTKRPSYYVLELYYISCFCLTLILPINSSTLFTSNTEMTRIDFFNFLKTYVPTVYWGWHVVALFFFSGIVLLNRIGKEKNLIQTIKGNKYVLEEILLLICIAGVLPGNVLAIRGGGGYYFSAVQQIIALIMFVGYGIPEDCIKKLYRKDSQVYKYGCIFVMSCIAWPILVNTIDNSKRFIVDTLKGSEMQSIETLNEGYWDQITQINAITEDSKKEYYLYVDPSAHIWSDFDNKEIAIHFYPAMTGLVSIGELYCENNKTYYNDGTANYAGWFKYNENEKKMSIEDAINKTVLDNKRGLVVVNESGYEILNIGANNGF